MGLLQPCLFVTEAIGAYVCSKVESSDVVGFEALFQALRDAVRACLTFLAELTAADAQSSWDQAPPAVALVLVGCVRLTALWLAEETESLREELLAALPGTVLAVAAAPTLRTRLLPLLLPGLLQAREDAVLWEAVMAAPVLERLADFVATEGPRDPPACCLAADVLLSAVDDGASPRLLMAVMGLGPVHPALQLRLAALELMVLATLPAAPGRVADLAALLLQAAPCPPATDDGTGDANSDVWCAGAAALLPVLPGLSHPQRAALQPLHRAAMQQMSSHSATTSLGLREALELLVAIGTGLESSS